MANFLKHSLLIIVSLSTSIGVVQADFDQGILDRAMGATSPNYKIGGQFVDPAVQAANFLTEELRKERDKERDSVRAKNIADTLIALVSEGRGVGGISDTPANDGERPLMEGSLREAARFLRALEHPNQDNFAAAQKPHAQRHLARVSEIMQAAYAGVVDVVDYNAGLQKEITRLQGEELKDDSDRKDYPTLVQEIVAANQDVGDPLKALKELTRLLKTTVIPEKAFQLAAAIMEELKAVDFSIAIPAAAVDALTSVEMFRMLETAQGNLNKVDPALFDYQGTAQTDASEAILLALVSAIQNHLYNHALTPEELAKLFKYQINSGLLGKGGVRIAAKAMIEDGRMRGIISQGLLNRIRAARLRIGAVQTLDIDAVAMRQALMFYSVPDFDMGTLQQKRTLPQFLRYFGSSGAGLQCGFFSLGFKTRKEAIDQILDNLGEPEILAMVDNNLRFGSDNIQAAMNAWVRFSGMKNSKIAKVLLKEKLAGVKKTLEGSRTDALAVDAGKRSPYQQEMAALTDKNIEERVKAAEAKLGKQAQEAAQELSDRIDYYIDLYAKKHGIDREGLSEVEQLEFYRKLYAEYEKLKAQISVEAAAIDAEFAQRKAEIGIVGRVPDDRNAEVAVLERPFFRKRAESLTKLLQFIYPDEDFRKAAEESMGKKFKGGELEFDPNPDWHLRGSTYPQILAELNGYNIYAWVTKSQFERMQREGEGSVANPIHTSEDGEYILITYLSSSPNGKSMGLLNKHGRHFEKWIAAGDYGRLARAVRHQNVFGNSGLTKDTTNDRSSSGSGSSAFDWPFL